jgi:predicted Zn-dependent protease with MMP-like domain
MDDKKLETLLESAYEALDEGDFEAAKKGLAKARKLAPDDVDVIVLDVDLRLEEATDEEAMGRALEPLESAVERSPDDPVLAATLASYVIELFEDYEDALPLLEFATRTLEKQANGTSRGGDGGRELQVDVLMLLAETLGALHDPRGALDAAERAVALDETYPGTQVALASARFDLCDLDGARAAARHALELDPDSAEAHWALGRLESARGDVAAADKEFAAATKLDPEHFTPPTRVTEGELSRLVEEGLAELPVEVRDFMKNIAIVIEDTPALERLTDQDPPLSPGILGLFEGTPPAHETTADPVALPRQITLFRRNIEIEATNRDELREIAVSTLVHEVGHYLGLDEEDLDARGLS